MAWLDLEEEILEEFSERTPTAFDSLGSEFATKFVHTIFRAGTRRTPGNSNECSVCGNQVLRNADTCSKRCTQIRRRRELIDSLICIRCKVSPAKNGAQMCISCGEAHSVITSAPKKKSNRIRKSARQNKGNTQESVTPAYGDRVLVTSCSSEDSETRGARVVFIGKRGRVVGDGEMLTVQFYGETRQKFHVGELLKLS